MRLPLVVITVVVIIASFVTYTQFWGTTCGIQGILLGELGAICPARDEKGPF